MIDNSNSPKSAPIIEKSTYKLVYDAVFRDSKPIWLLTVNNLAHESPVGGCSGNQPIYAKESPAPQETTLPQESTLLLELFPKRYII